ncbi:MAG: type II secretion system protein N, partial [Acidiferrobacterales bacterium]
MAATDSLANAGKQAMSALSEGLNRLLGRRLPAILNIAALLVLTGSLAQWTWKLVQPPLPVIPQKSDSVQTSATSFDLQGLLAAHLFGRAVAPATAAPAPVATIPTSPLDLVLTGVVAGRSESYALIRVNNEPETPFAIGDEIAHGVSLHAVHPDRAIIERRGSKEALLLEDKTAGATESPVVASATPTRKPSRIVERSGDNNFAVNRELVSQELRNPELFR